MAKAQKDTDTIIGEVAGADVLPLVHALRNKRNVSEFKIAEQLKLEINVIRNMLYRLLHANLVSFIRRKDKKKGWYIYYWTFKPKMVPFHSQDLRKKRLEGLKERLQRERDNHFYVCDHRCMRLSFEQAMDYEFKCPECGNLMNQEDNAKVIEKIEDEIKRMESEV
ncbi:MAG TPA: hypothetical protein VJK52_03945 [Candidatus Nanoarchaeia archaeon]|nr:hypothetical protein [Candidatus Nanoarchaeia archaeon]